MSKGIETVEEAVRTSDRRARTKKRKSKTTQPPDDVEAPAEPEASGRRCASVVSGDGSCYPLCTRNSFNTRSIF